MRIVKLPALSVLSFTLAAVASARPQRDVPLHVFVSSSAKGDENAVALIDEGLEELVRQLRKKKFRIVASREEADLAVELTAYWVREAMEAREQRLAAPMGGFHLRQETWVERQHNLLGVVFFRGEVRELTGVQVKKNGGSVKGAAKDLAQQIERLAESDELR